MLNFTQKNQIRKKVMSIINEKIDKAQKEHDEAIALLEDAHAQEIEHLNKEMEIKQIKMLDEQVDKIIGKFI